MNVFPLKYVGYSVWLSAISTGQQPSSSVSHEKFDRAYISVNTSVIKRFDLVFS